MKNKVEKQKLKFYVSCVRCFLIFFNLFLFYVLFVCSAGKNELLAPQGKFYIENDTQETEEEEKNEIFFWGNIVEPRLLFP